MAELQDIRQQPADQPVIRVQGVRTQFGKQVIHDNLDLEVRRGEVLGLVGGSGTGKSVLLKEIIGLMQPATGRIEVLGDVVTDDPEGRDLSLRQRWGVLFQVGALFSSLTVAQNIEVPMRELTDFPPQLMHEIARIKIAMVGLPPETAAKYPSQLSGGMKKRAGLARALALDPELLFLDEPTAGLDPIAASQFDELIKHLQESLGLTVMMVTHDLDSLRAICDRIAVLVDKRARVGTLEELLQDDHPWIKEYFHGPRGRAAMADVANNRKGPGTPPGAPAKQQENA
jgi:phospholipid/cholesterol/gamma-HCH transport system ATP-binding protein